MYACKPIWIRRGQYSSILTASTTSSQDQTFETLEVSLLSTGYSILQPQRRIRDPQALHAMPSSLESANPTEPHPVPVPVRKNAYTPHPKVRAVGGMASTRLDPRRPAESQYFFCIDSFRLRVHSFAAAECFVLCLHAAAVFGTDVERCMSSAFICSLPDVSRAEPVTRPCQWHDHCISSSVPGQGFG